MDSKQAAKKKKWIISWRIILGCFIIGVSVFVVSCGKNSAENKVVTAITPYAEHALEEVKKQDLLPDISYEIRVDKCTEFRKIDGKDRIMAEGDIVLLSDEIETKYQDSPAAMYKKMQEISEVFFGDLYTGSTSEIQEDGISFWLMHGTGASTWKTSDGTIYEASYFNLEKNGVEIYDNPDNDLEEALNPKPSKEQKEKETAADTTCQYQGCSNQKVEPGKYCRQHTCATYGCYRPITNGSKYCYKHKPSNGKKKDQYNTSDYDDPDDFYEDYYYDFEDYDEAEQYYDENH